LIDAVELLALWKQRLAAITANANELSEAESTKRIRIRVREGRYQGMTKQCAEAAIATISRLRDDYLLLARVIDEAVQAHQGGLFTSRETRNEKVAALLCSPSISRAAGAVPLEKRTLLGSANRHEKMTPDQLLALMQQEFESARDLLNKIDSVEAKGKAELDGLRRDFAGMEERAARLQASSGQPSFIELQDVQSDPLNAQSGMDSLKRGLRTWSGSLDELEHVRVSAQEAVARARTALDDLKRLSGDYQTQLVHLKELFGESAMATLTLAPGTQLEMLSSWCGTLENMLIAGQWSAVSVGAGRLNIAMSEAIGNVNRAIAEAQTRCAEADELKGHFIALRAKEKSLFGPGTPNEAASLLRGQIDAAINFRPLELDEARALIQKYQNIMLAAGRR
jgi:chromosome segregation ATPase